LRYIQDIRKERERESSAGSVPGLVLVVPSVEVVVEEHDASRRHAGDDAP